MKKSISRLIDEQIASNHILSDEEVGKLLAPIDESDIFDEVRLNEDISYIDNMYAKCSTEMERDSTSVIIKEELMKRQNLDESKCGY